MRDGAKGCQVGSGHDRADRTAPCYEAVVDAWFLRPRAMNNAPAASVETYCIAQYPCRVVAFQSLWSFTSTRIA